MGVIVKRKFWIFSAIMPVILKFNGKSVGALYSSQEMTIPMQEDEGELKYYQLVGRNDQLQVKNGDVIEVGETLLGKMLSILFTMFMLYLLTKTLGILVFTSFSNYEELIFNEQIIFGIILAIALISLFFKTHKLKVINYRA